MGLVNECFRNNKKETHPLHSLSDLQGMGMAAAALIHSLSSVLGLPGVLAWPRSASLSGCLPTVFWPCCSSYELEGKALNSI